MAAHIPRRVRRVKSLALSSACRISAQWMRHPVLP
jgi:hypothetical protein